MSKTPEEMAEEYLDKNYELDPHFPADVQGDKLPDRQAARPAFLAGYKAAQEQYREAVEVLDKHKAAAEKAVTNIKNASDWVTIERLEGNSLDPIINLPTPAKWISVKDRLPEIEQRVLILIRGRIFISSIEEEYGDEYRDGAIRFWDGDWNWPEVTHWMELPEPPKEEKLITSLDQIHRPQKRISVEEAREMFPDKPPKEEK